jgi:hypothetical protein
MLALVMLSDPSAATVPEARAAARIVESLTLPGG